MAPWQAAVGMSPARQFSDHSGSSPQVNVLLRLLTTKQGTRLLHLHTVTVTVVLLASACKTSDPLSRLFLASSRHAVRNPCRVCVVAHLGSGDVNGVMFSNAQQRVALQKFCRRHALVCSILPSKRRGFLPFSIRCWYPSRP